MHAVSALIAGIRGAEGGYARVYRRGTATRATWYTSFEGDGANSSGEDIELDGNGGAAIYVDQLVDVVVLDQDGAEVRRFTDGYGASSIEVRSQSFTGADYDDASSGAGSNYPTTLAAVLDLWKTKTGAIDWNVLLGGSVETLTTALGVVAGPLVYNVKADGFGAAGDGVTDDTTAIAAAITAATAAGGIVFFPPGTYIVSADLSVPAKVSLVGCGTSSTAIVMGDTIVFTGAGSYEKQWMHGLRVYAGSGTSEHVVQVNDGARVGISSCHLGGDNNNGCAIYIDTSTTSDVSIVDSTLSTAGTTEPVAAQNTDSARLVFTRCKFVVANLAFAAAGGVLSAKTVKCVDCLFDGSAVTGGSFSYFKSSSTTLNSQFRGCKFLNGSGATVTAFELGSYGASSIFFEDDSVFGSSVTAYSYTAAHAGNSYGASVRLMTRESRIVEVTDDSATISGGTLLFKQYGTIILRRTTNGNQTIRLFTLTGGYLVELPPSGSRSTLVIANASGGTITAQATLAHSTDLIGAVIDDGLVAVAAATHNYTAIIGSDGKGSFVTGIPNAQTSLFL